MPKKKITLLPRKAGLYLADAGHKGRGVFCTKPIRKGETLEITPVVLLNEAETDSADKGILNDYTFIVGKISEKQKKSRGIKDTENASAVLFGLMTFCNHDEHPNAEIVWEEQGGTLYYFLIATRAIPKHTEICTSYGDTWFEERKMSGITKA